MTNTYMLNHLLHTHHLTQQQLAHLLNSNQATISRKINNQTRITLEDLHTLSHIFHLPIGTLANLIYTPTLPTNATHLQTNQPIFNSIILTPENTGIRAYIPANSQLVTQLQDWYNQPTLTRSEFLTRLQHEHSGWENVAPTFDPDGSYLTTSVTNAHELREQLLTLVGKSRGKSVLSYFLTPSLGATDRQTVLDTPVNELPPVDNPCFLTVKKFPRVEVSL